MRNLILLLALTGTAFWTSCGGNAPTELEDQAWEKMMEVHDEVMPKMAEMNRVGRELKALSKDMKEKAKLEQVNKALKDLEAASEGMMAWMGTLQQPKKLREEKSHEEIMAYLKAETQKIAQVKQDMLGSLEQGQALLEALQAEATAE